MLGVFFTTTTPDIFRATLANTPTFSPFCIYGTGANLARNGMEWDDTSIMGLICSDGWDMWMGDGLWMERLFLFSSFLLS
jgi:hypothetical protein